ncbi:hypothetical protein FOA52_012737 [Chlamydomonas sp. UWO 241]|nr:hypothetical protein FOA52_012737 [Chlamydomonas sp. UWO 241]
MAALAAAVRMCAQGMLDVAFESFVRRKKRKPGSWSPTEKLMAEYDLDDDDSYHEFFNDFEDSEVFPQTSIASSTMSTTFWEDSVARSGSLTAIGSSALGRLAATDALVPAHTPTHGGRVVRQGLGAAFTLLYVLWGIVPR